MERRNENNVEFAFGVPPCEIVGCELEERGIPRGVFADKIGMKRSNFSDLINGKRRLTESIATRIEEELDIPSRVLLKMQDRYDRYNREQKERSKVKTASDIAEKIIKYLYELSRCESRCESNDATNMTVQKLLYYQQAYHLAKYGTPLFADEIEAWQYGPVVPGVYQKYKGYGNKAIRCPRKDVLLTWEEEKLFSRVMDKYCEYSAIGLMRMTHKEKPWIQASERGLNTVISTDSMMEYFKNKRL